MKEKLAAAALATSALLAAGCEANGGEPAVPEHTASATAETPSAAPKETVVRIGALVMAADGKPTHFTPERVKAIEQGLETYVDAGTARIDLQFVNAKTIQPTSLTPVERKALKDIDTSQQERIDILKPEAIDGISHAQKAGEISPQDITLVFADVPRPNKSVVGIEEGFSDDAEVGPFGVIEPTTLAEDIANAKHEIGHKLGLGHAEMAQCDRIIVTGKFGSLPVLIDEKTAKTCTTVDEYGGHNSIMSNTDTPDLDPFSASEEQRLDNWLSSDLLPENQVLRVDQPGTTKTQLEALRNATKDGVKKIEIPLPAGVTPPLQGIETDGLDWAYVVELSGNIGKQVGGKTQQGVSLKLYLESRDEAGVLTGPTYYFQLNDNATGTFDLGVGHEGAGKKVFEDERFGLSIGLNSLDTTDQQAHGNAGLEITRA